MSFQLGAAEPSVTVTKIGQLPSGENVRQFVLRNRHGLQATFIEYGATLTDLQVPDRNGQFTNVVLGTDSLDTYLKGFPAASVIGRYANRISQARFMLDGQEISVTKNSGENHIHGGKNNFAKVNWKGAGDLQTDGASVKFNYVSADGEEGFPGTVTVEVLYTLTSDNELKISYQAETDRPTVLNITNHAYFNLAGAGKDVLVHQLQLAAESYTAVDRSLIPTGEILSVAGTPLDFQQPHSIGERIKATYELTGGYDHNYVVNGEPGTLRLAAQIFEPSSGRTMECFTTEPGVQLYTANGFNGDPFPKHGGVCMETQHYPDSPNRPEFPSTIVRPGKPWNSITTFRFSTKP